MEELVQKEIDRLTDMLAELGVPEKKISIYEPIIENTALMKAKLDEAKELIKNSSIAISYDNGGGQKGIRENPIFKGYESLWKAYMSGMQKIIDLLPETEYETKQQELEAPKTMLEIVRARKQA